MEDWRQRRGELVVGMEGSEKEEGFFFGEVERVCGMAWLGECGRRRIYWTSVLIVTFLNFKFLL